MNIIKKRKSKPPLIITWDTETYKKTTPEGDVLVLPYLIGWFCEGHFYYSTEPHTGFFDFLAIKAKEYKLFLWAFNANYDLTVLIPSYLKQLPKASISYKVSDAGSFIKCVYRCKNFRFEVKDASIWDRQHASLNDWFNVLKINNKVEGFVYEKWNVKIIGNEVYFDDKNGNKQKPSFLGEELKYLLWDVEGLLKVVEFQEKQRNELCSMTIPFKPKVKGFTSPSMSIKLIDSFMNERGWFLNTFRPVIEAGSESVDVYNRMINSNIGGFTSFNKDRYHWEFDEEKIFSYDVNSMYPYIMAKGLPCGKLLDKIPEKGPYFTWYEIKVNKCEWIKKYKNISNPPIPVRVIEKDLNFFIIKEYYDFVLQNSIHDIEIIEIYYQRKNYDLGRFVRNAYKLKVDAKKETDPIKRINALNNIKIILNSLYGKLGEKVYGTEKFYDIDICNFRSEQVYIEEYRYTLSGAFVSQMGRFIMMQVITKEIENGNIFIYSDTDSIKLVVNNPVKFPVDPIKLGFFKNEGWGDDVRGYTSFYHNGSLKKNLIFSNKDVKKSIKLTLSGVVKDIHKDLLKNASLDILKELFSLEKRIVIVEGGKDRTKNKFGQKLLGRTMICLRGPAKEGTHILQKTENFWEILKLKQI